MPLLFSKAEAGLGGAPPSGGEPRPCRELFPPRAERDAAPGAALPGEPRQGRAREPAPGAGGETRGRGERGEREAPRARGKSRLREGNAGRGCRRGAEERRVPAGRGSLGGLAGRAGGPALRKPRSAASSRRRCGNSRLGAGLSLPLATLGLSALPAPPASTPAAAAGEETPRNPVLVSCLHRWRGSGSGARQSGASLLTYSVPVRMKKRSFFSKDLEEIKILCRQNSYNQPVFIF